MAPDKTVDIGSFSIASKVDKDFALTVSTSMSLSLPEHLADNLTAKDLRDQVKAGALWLTRASSCRVTLAIHFEYPTEMPVHGDTQRRQLAMEAFQSFPIWHDLGLELRLELNVLQSNRTPSTNSVYYMQHAQQQSGLFVPQNVPCGYLSGFSCSFRYAARTSRAPGSAEESVTRPRNHARYNLRNLTRTHIEPRSGNNATFWDLPLDIQADRVVHLTHNALDRMLGTRKRCVGIWCFKGTKPPALLELAPAVWNAQYFQNVVARAQFIPAISSALGNLMSTQSPVLRRKIESLVSEPAAGSGLDEVLVELQRRTQILLLRSARDQKTKTCLPRIQAHSAHSPVLVLSQEGPSLPNTSIGNDFTNYASLDRVQESLHGQEVNQSHESVSGLPDHSLMHLESESSYGFTTYRASSAGRDRIDLAHCEDYMDSDLGGTEWIDDDDVVSCTPESLLEYADLYNEHCMGEILDLTYSERGHQEQRLAPDDKNEHDMDLMDFQHESDIYGQFYETSEIEDAVQPTVYALEDQSVESNRVAGNLENTGDDYSDFVPDGDEVIGDNVYGHLGDDDRYFNEDQDELWETNDDYDQGDMLQGGSIDNDAGYITTAHTHQDDHAEAAQSNVRVGWHGQQLQDWSQVPRGYAKLSTEGQWARPGPHQIGFTSRLADYR